MLELNRKQLVRAIFEHEKVQFFRKSSIQLKCKQKHLKNEMKHWTFIKYNVLKFSLFFFFSVMFTWRFSDSAIIVMESFVAIWLKNKILSSNWLHKISTEIKSFRFERKHVIESKQTENWNNSDTWPLQSNLFCCYLSYQLDIKSSVKYNTFKYTFWLIEIVWCYFKYMSEYYLLWATTSFQQHHR